MSQIMSPVSETVSPVSQFTSHVSEIMSTTSEVMSPLSEIRALPSQATAKMSSISLPESTKMVITPSTLSVGTSMVRRKGKREDSRFALLEVRLQH